MLRPISFAAFILIGAAASGAPQTAMAQSGSEPARGNVESMLDQAQRFTVRVRSTVTWPFAPEMPGTGFGTGFIVDLERGWILTNAHVARRSPATIEVAFGESDAQWLAAEKVFVDNHLDVAVVKLPKESFPADAAVARLGCNAPVKQGASVVAYGHPINLSFTATRGIVSSVRTLSSQEFVQMDANINPGNSGGPLLAVETAEVVGINTGRILRRARSGAGIVDPPRLSGARPARRRQRGQSCRCCHFTCKRKGLRTR